MSDRVFNIDACDFAAEAEQCERCANLCHNDADKQLWLNLAARWRAVADYVADRPDAWRRPKRRGAQGTMH